MRDQVNWYLERARAAARAGSVGAVDRGRAGRSTASLRTAAKIHRDRGVEFDGDVAPELRFRGERQDLEEMVGNLVDNGGKWAEARCWSRCEPAAGKGRDGRSCASWSTTTARACPRASAPPC